MGVCDVCRIMVLKIADDATGTMDIADEIQAINYAKAQGVRILNMSLGGAGWANSEREAIRRSGALAVVAAGNDALDNDMFLNADSDGDTNFDTFSPSYPAAFSLNNILTVGASNDMDENAYFSACFNSIASKPECAFTNWGHDSVDVSAPGVDIQSTVPGNAFETWDGTSMATPHVAGIAGVLRSLNSDLTVAQLKNKIMRSVDKPTSLDTIYMPSYVNGAPLQRNGAFTRTTGRVNLLSAIGASTANATPLTDGNINGAKGMSTASVNGSIAWPADINDVYKRKLYRGRTYQFTLDGPLGKNFDLWVWKPGTLEVWQVADACYSGGSSCKIMRVSASGDADEVVRFKASITGVYYVHVTAYRFQSGMYTLKFKPL
jgi:subtilisin family serine protease